MIAGEDVVSLSSLKKHLRIEHDDEDIILGEMRDAACRHTEAFIGPLDAFADGVPADVVEAIKRLISAWFDQREAISEETLRRVPFGYHDLIGPYRKWEF